ncbi:hypothetical protein AAJ76_300032844 [Vairimorpha ceranae]|uniref:Uncharacterized protein n=1 Tax=Vairimorpha ceranae TaxID=40302 RepID=A0A0F9YVH4_9MICR|nr:hypothetical protein AAJ76_300032844 [Vairimorpha ceranae]KKO76402.1 hypothetical protein AAJ76_300032844 [Vairimorpha ceranae]
MFCIHLFTIVINFFGFYNKMKAIYIIVIFNVGLKKLKWFINVLNNKFLPCFISIYLL